MACNCKRKLTSQRSAEEKSNKANQRVYVCDNGIEKSGRNPDRKVLICEVSEVKQT